MYETTANMRATLYSYMQSQYNAVDNQTIEKFTAENNFSISMINSFMKGKDGSFLSEEDFDKLCNILNPSSRLKERWKKMYLYR